MPFHQRLSAPSACKAKCRCGALSGALPVLPTKPIAPFAKEFAKHVAADDKAMHASLDAVMAELPAEVIAPTAAGSTVRAAGPQVGRNDPCPCGSGKKHKKCCGA